jgi:peptide/nickel transport system substrate-binding protein/oligopeptide transport system substrate-binding protein
VAAAGSEAGARERDDADAGRAYRRPLGNDPASLDPAGISDVYSRAVAQQIFDGLVEFDQTLSVVPALAQFWKASRDGLTWTFTLRRGVRFHHGREVTADDVVYSFTRLVEPRTKSAAADLFGGIKGAQEFREGKASQVAGLVAPDRYTVQVTLTEAMVPFVSLLAAGHAKIVPRDVVESAGDAFGARPVGTGPFRFVRWDRGREITLAANPEYFGGPPRLKRIVYRVFPGEPIDAIAREFEAGKLEDSPVPSRYKADAGEPRHQYIRRPMFSVRFYGLNSRVKPLDDRRVRQAVVAAVDRQSILEEIFLDRYHPAKGLLPPGTPGYNPKLTAPSFSPERARDLLRQAGYPEGRGLPPIQIWASVKSERLVREHQTLRRQLAAVGIPASVEYQTDWPTFSKMLAEGRMPAFLHAWYADVPDPDNFLFKLFHSRSPRNYMGYSNPVVDELLVRARRTPDLAVRVELYRRAEQLIVDDAPILPFWHYTYERLFQSYVRSVEVNGLGDPYVPLRKIWLERPR